MNKFSLTLLAAAMLATSARADILLGTFDFNSSEFGNTLTESDGGTFRAANWLNVVDSDPGNPGALTGANFDTGIANIPLSSSTIDYTIGYNTPIVNVAGADMGLVVGFSFASDTYHIAVSTDGVSFTSFLDFAGSSGTNTGVSGSYFYGGGGPFTTNLIVIPIDLSAFGIASGDSIVAARVEGRTSEQADVFRIAGFGSPESGPPPAVPEPSSVILFASSVAAFLVLRSRNKATS